MSQDHHSLRDLSSEIANSKKRIEMYTSSPHLSLERYEASGKTKSGLMPEMALQHMAIETPSEAPLS